MGKTLNMQSDLACPHQGKVTWVPSHPHTSADGALVATEGGTWTITGCSQQSPCVSVRWSTPDQRVFVNGEATVSDTSVGECLNGANTAQGFVVVRSTQQRVSSS